MDHHILKLLFATALFVGTTQAQTIITVDSYTIETGLSAAYPDTGNVELTDGTTSEGAAVWPTSPSASTQNSLVSWFNTTPTITLNFGTSVRIGEIRFWYADSGGSAGVRAPTELTVNDANSSYSFTSAVSTITNSGTVVMEADTGLDVTTNQIQLVFTPGAGNSHTMLTEVQVFSAVPEPASFAVLAGIAGLGFTLTRRSRYRTKTA
ncbi:MAG: hypothetical protein SynsKO_40790 [Synoicihabitans sp.]